MSKLLLNTPQQKVWYSDAEIHCYVYKRSESDSLAEAFAAKQMAGFFAWDVKIVWDVKVVLRRL